MCDFILWEVYKKVTQKAIFAILRKFSFSGPWPLTSQVELMRPAQPLASSNWPLAAGKLNRSEPLGLFAGEQVRREVALGSIGQDGHNGLARTKLPGQALGGSYIGAGGDAAHEAFLAG